MTLRSVAVIGLALLLALQVLRQAAVALPYGERPALAERLWQSHPTLLIERSMAEIGGVAARGEEVPSATRERVASYARKAPLAADPFLIEGAIAQSEGREAAAGRLFLEARARDPRSSAARYFLADRNFRTGRIADGLVEMAALARLEPRAAAPFVPALVAFARSPGAVPELKRFLRTRPRVETAVLSVLADDAGNADLILALATPTRSRAGKAPGWQGKIITQLARAGQYRKAHATWTRLSGVRAGPGLFNPGFAPLAAPPPFNWSFPASGDGLAEPAGDGRLEVLYYGRQKAVLASQLLLLPAGRYRLTMEASGDLESGGLHWSARCDDRPQQLLQLPLRSPATQASFAVPADCPAQWLELIGTPSDFPKTVELSIARLRLAREGGS